MCAYAILVRLVDNRVSYLDIQMFSTSTAIFLTSLLGIPLTYVVNKVNTFHGEWALLLTGIGALALVIFIVKSTTGSKGQPKDPFIYGMYTLLIFFTYTCTRYCIL